MYTTSVCSGSMLLGAAGLLQGKEATTHWMVLKLLSNFGAIPVSSRVVQSVRQPCMPRIENVCYDGVLLTIWADACVDGVQGKIITAAGVSAGIDMGLKLAALLSDETTAKVVQLMMEYDPEPPFNCGSVAKASPDVVAMARGWVEKMMPDVKTQLEAAAFAAPSSV